MKQKKGDIRLSSLVTDVSSLGTIDDLLIVYDITSTVVNLSNLSE